MTHSEELTANPACVGCDTLGLMDDFAIEADRAAAAIAEVGMHGLDSGTDLGKDMAESMGGLAEKLPRRAKYAGEWACAFSQHCPGRAPEGGCQMPAAGKRLLVQLVEDDYIMNADPRLLTMKFETSQDDQR